MLCLVSAREKITPMPGDESRPAAHPVLLILGDKPIVVVGGGVVAERKIAQLIESGARVTVVSPEVTEGIRQWAGLGRIRLERRRYRAGDLRGARLALVATDDEEVNEAVRAEADAEGVWLNVADRPELCDFFTPAVVRRGELTVAVSTGGASPALARRIRENLELCFGPEFGAALAELRAIRERCRAGGRDLASERERIAQIIDRLLPPAISIPASGKVFLVGAGPGDPDLITLKGRAALARADVVIHDALVDKRLLELCRAGARCIYAGKREGRHSLPQDDINQLLVDEARAGRIVVRLKGGDPFIFGRGGEEAQALVNAGIPYEVVPGVSAGVGVPAYAGIPLTHRAFASELVFLTGHECTGGSGIPVDWGRHAPGASTLVIFMGRDRLPDLVRLLLEYGRNPECPVAVIFAGTTARQHTIVAPLREIAVRAAAEESADPALIVVGEVVRLRDALQWFEEPRQRRREACRGVE